MSAPDRIWLTGHKVDQFSMPPSQWARPEMGVKATEYIRDDLVAQAETRAWNAAIEAARLLAQRHRGEMQVPEMIDALRKKTP